VRLQEAPHAAEAAAVAGPFAAAAAMKVVSLFSGCGGLDYGLHQVGGTVLRILPCAGGGCRGNERGTRCNGANFLWGVTRTASPRPPAICRLLPFARRLATR